MTPTNATSSTVPPHAVPPHAVPPRTVALRSWRATAALLVFSAALGGLLLFGLAATDEAQLTASCDSDSCDSGCPASTSPESVAPTSCSEIHSSLRGGTRVDLSLSATDETARLLNILADGS